MNRAQAALCLVVAFLPSVAIAEEAGRSPEEMVVEMTETPEQHAELARYYATKAEEAREESRSHERLSRSYSAGQIGERQLLAARDCEKLANSYGRVAESLDELAKLHWREARKGR